MPEEISKQSAPARNERQRQIIELISEALTRDGLERIAFLDSACAGNPQLRAEVAIETSHRDEPALLRMHGR